MNLPIRIGMDTSKSVFQLHGVDENEVVVVCRQFRRAEMIRYRRRTYRTTQRSLLRAKRIRDLTRPERSDRRPYSRRCASLFVYRGQRPLRASTGRSIPDRMKQRLDEEDLREAEMLVDRRAPQTGRDATSASSRRSGRTSRSRDLSRLHETVGEAIGLTLDRGIEHLYRVWIVLVCEYGALRVH